MSETSIKEILKNILRELRIDSSEEQFSPATFIIKDYGFSFGSDDYSTSNRVDKHFVEDGNLVLLFTSETPQQSTNRLVLTPTDFEEMSEWFDKLFTKED